MLSANQLEDIRCQAMLCRPSKLSNVCKVYPMTVGDIVEMGQNRYKQLLYTLLLDEVEIQKILKEKLNEEVAIEEIDPLTYLLMSADNNDTFSLELQEAFSTFIKEEVLFLPKLHCLVVGKDLKQKRLITSKNFVDFQNILKVQNGKKLEEPPPENESDWDRRMRLRRKLVAEIKSKKAQEANDGKSFDELIEIATVYGIDVDKVSLLAFYNLMRRYQAREKWVQDLQMLCAGADSSKIETKYWGESFKNE